MGAAPSSEVLAQAPFCSPGAGARQIALLPMTREFFPSADCTLFRQLYEARIDPSVRYYVRHKLNVLAQDVIPPFPCTREELYKWYVYYTPRLCYPSNAALRADAAAGCLHRIHPVPCAVVFLYRGAAHHMPEDCVPLVHRDNMYVKVVGGIADVQPFLASIGEEGPADKPARQERTLQMQMFITKSAGDHNMAHVVLLAAYIYQHQCLDLIGLPRMPSHGVAFKNYQTNIPFLCFLRELRDRTASLLDAAEAVRLWLDGPLIRGYVPAACMARLFDAFTQHYVAFVEAKTNQRLLKAQGQQQQMQQQMQQHVQQPQQQQVAPTAIVAAAPVPTTPLREMPLSQPPPPPQQQRPLMSSDENEDEQEEEDENSVMDMLDKAVMAAQDEVATQLAAEAEENAMTRTVAATGHDVGQHGMLGTAKEEGTLALQQQPIITTSTSSSSSQAQPQHGYCYCPQLQAAHNNNHNTTTSTSSNGGNQCCCDGSSSSTDAHAVCICAPALCACGPDLGTLTEESNSLSTTLIVTTTQSASANAKPQSPPLISCHTNSMAGATQSGRPEQTMSAHTAFASVTPQPSLTRQTSSSTITTATATAVTNTKGTAGAAAEGGMRLAKMTPADTAVLAVVNNARIVPPARKQSYTVKGYIVGPEAVIPDYCDALDGVYVVCTDSEVHVCHDAMAPFAGISSASVCPGRAASPCGTRRESGVSTEAEGTHNEAQQPQQQRQAEAHAGSHTSSSSLAATAAAATSSKEEDKEASAEACRVVMTLQVRKGDILSFTPHEGNTNNSCSNNSHEDVKAAIAAATTAITADTHTCHEDRPGGEQQQLLLQEDKGHQDTSDQAAHTTTTITNTTAAAAAAAELSRNSNTTTTTTGAAAAGDDARVQQQPQQQTTSSSNSARTTDTTTYDLSKLRYGSWRVDPSVYLESVLLSMVSDECRRAREAGPEHANWVRDPTTHNLVHDDNFYIWRFIRNGQAYYYGTVPHFASIHKRGGTLRASQMGHLNLSHHTTNGSSAAYARPPPHHHRSHLAAQQQQQQQRQQQQRVGNQAHLHAMHASHMAFLHAQQQQQQQRVMQENEARQAMMYLDGGYNSAAATKVYAYDMLPSLQQQQQQQQQVMMMMQRLPTAPAAQPLPLISQQPQQQQHVAFSPAAAAAANTTTALAPSPFMTEAHPFARGAMPLPAMQAFLPQPTFFTPAPTITTTTSNGNNSNTCARVGSHSAAAEYEAMSSMSSGHTSSAAALMSNAAAAGAGSTHGSGYPLMPIPPPPPQPTGTTHTPVQQQPQPHALLHPSAPLSASSSSPFASPADLTPATLRPHHNHHHHNNNTIMTTTASSGTTQGNGLSGVLSAGAPAAAAAPAQYVLVHTNGLPTGPVTPLPQAAAGLHAPSSHNIANATTTTAAGNAAAMMMVSLPLPPQQRTQPQQQPPPYGNAERVMSHTPLTAPTNTPAAATTSAAAAAGPMMMSTGHVTGASAMHADMMAAQTHRTTPHPPTPPPSSSIAGPAMMMPYTPSTAATSAAAAHKEPGTTSNTMYYIVRTDGQPRLTTLQQTAHGLTPVLMPTTPHPFASPHNSTTTTHGTMAAAAAAGGEGGGNAGQAATRPVYVVVHDSAASMSIQQRSHSAQPASSTVGPHSLTSQAAALSAPGSHAHNMNSPPVAVGGEGMMMLPSQQEMAVQQGQTPYAMMLSLAAPPPPSSQQQQQPQPPTTNAAQHAMMMMPTTSTAMMGGNAMPMTKNGREDEARRPVNAMTSVLDMNAPASRPGQQQQQQQQQQQHFAQPAYVCYQDATRQPMAVSGVNGCYIMPGSTPPSASAAAASSMLLQQQQQAMHADMSATYLMR